MNISLKPYQEIAVAALVDATKTLLSKEGEGKVCIFQAPTASGKTLMMAKFIEEVISEIPEKEMCFIWVTIGKGDLHLQSKLTLERVFEGAPKVSLIETEFAGVRGIIGRNEIVVANWEKLRNKDNETKEWANVLMKDGEKVNFREVLINTRERRKIILIIDESHEGANAERTTGLREEINADITFEVSATPIITISPFDIKLGMADIVVVDPKDVIAEGMIKKEIIINDNIERIAADGNDSQEVVLEAAFRKRLELKKYYEAEGSNINPLVLIQIPTALAGEDKIRAIRGFLENKGITELKGTEGNGKLAIWLAEQKSETLDSVREPDNEIQFLIFKQAINVGWDCPRAHILIKFREIRSPIFEIQTVGRILRMPELKHYTNEALNRGYIFTNIQSVVVKKEEYNPNIIKYLKAERTRKYGPLRLISYYRSRVDYGDITASFYPVFERAACERFGLRPDTVLFQQNVDKLIALGLALDLKKYQQEIIANAKINVLDFDDLEGEIASADRARLTIAGNDLQAVFEGTIIEHLGSFKNIKRSVPSVKSAIYSWFRKYIGSKNWPEETLLIQMVFVHNGNREYFETVLTSAVDAYTTIRQREIQKRVIDRESFYDFEVPEATYYNEHLDEKVVHKKYVYDPCYLNRDRSIPEKVFETYCEANANKLIWWWKNGENSRDYFGIRYEYPEGIPSTFYPDYLVRFIDGRIGVFEVKEVGDRDGSTSTKAKAEALARYITENGDKNLFGGIVINKSGLHLINNKGIYDWEKPLKADWSDWRELRFN